MTKKKNELDEKEEKLLEKMRGPNGVHVTHRTWRMKKYPNCFIGSELVTWLVENTETKNRKSAVTLGEHLRRKGAFYHVASSHEFQDGVLFYRFTTDEVDRTRTVWKSDKSSDCCSGCGVKWTFANRRHHCRECGDLVCGSCSSHRKVLQLGQKPVRICVDCWRGEEILEHNPIGRIKTDSYSSITETESDSDTDENENEGDDESLEDDMSMGQSVILDIDFPDSMLGSTTSHLDVLFNIEAEFDEI